MQWEDKLFLMQEEERERIKMTNAEKFLFLPREEQDMDDFSNSTIEEYGL